MKRDRKNFSTIEAGEFLTLGLLCVKEYSLEKSKGQYMFLVSQVVLLHLYCILCIDTISCVDVVLSYRTVLVVGQ